MTDQEFNDKLEQLMDCFDFGKVARAMSLLEWTWFDAESSDKIPLEYELRSHVRKRFKKLHKDKFFKGSLCGGFNLSIEHNELYAQFILTEWETTTG